MSAAQDTARGKGAEDRRRYVRTELQLPLELCDPAGERRLSTGSTVNISPGGLLAEMEGLEEQAPGTALGARIGLPPELWPQQNDVFQVRLLRHGGEVEGLCALGTLGEPPDFLYFPELIGFHPLILAVKRDLRHILDHDVNVLVQGESGTGKNLVAAVIHRYSKRRAATFMRVNCPAIPDTLLESQLFGHEKGAFTDARNARPGLLRMADRGTVILDDISAAPSVLQAKLLQLLEEKRFIPVGARGAVEVDVRMVATSNDQLEQRVREGTFRKDLYYRLNEVTISLPPLRDRKSDLPILADHLVRTYSARFRKEYRPLDAATIAMFMKYNWPGNVRELENTVKRGVLMGQFDGAAAARPVHAAEAPHPAPAGPLAAPVAPVKFASLREARNEAEKQALIATLIESDYNRTNAAARLGISYQTLLRRMKKYKIEL